jgi:hypothetical protein
MKYESRSRGVNVVLLLLALLASGVVGCMSYDRGFEVVPVSNRNVISLSSDDVVRIMRRAGFSDEQILDIGAAVHNGMLTSGAVQIKLNNKVEVVFAANGDDVYIGTRLRGNFIYNVKTGWNRPGGVLP